MKVYILDDYDYDCEVIEFGNDYYSYVTKDKKLYEVPDALVKEYSEINKHREKLKEKILLIERQCRLADLANPVNGVQSKGFN